MSVGTIVLIIAGSLLVDLVIFFMLIRPRIQRAKFIAFLQERGLSFELKDGEVGTARGQWEGVPCEMAFDTGEKTRSLFRMQLTQRFPAGATVRFRTGQRSLHGDDGLDRLRQRLREGELLNIESDDDGTVEALFSNPDVQVALLKVMRFQPEWLAIEAGHLCYELPILARGKTFVVWIFDQLLPLARAMETAVEKSHPAEKSHAAHTVGRVPYDAPPIAAEVALPPEPPRLPAQSPQLAPSSPSPAPVGARLLLVTVERTETTMGFDLPEALQWGVTVLGTCDDGRRVRVLFPREQADEVRNLETGARREFPVQAAEPPSSDDRETFHKL